MRKIGASINVVLTTQECVIMAVYCVDMHAYARGLGTECNDVLYLSTHKGVVLNSGNK